MPNIWQRFKYAVTGNAQSLAIARRPSQSKIAPFLWPQYVDGQPQWQITDYDSYVNEGFNLNSLIYSAIMYKARAQIASPLRAYTGDVDDPEPLPPEDPLTRLVNRPNIHQSMVEFRQQQIVYINLSGDNFCFFDRPSPGAPPESLYNLRPDRVLIVPGKVDGQATIKAYVYVPEGRSIFTRANSATRREMIESDRAVLIHPADMMHTKYPNPGDRLEGMGYGLSPISALARSGDVDNSITHFLQLFFQNGVMLPGVLSSDQPLDDPTIARIKENWKEMYGGYYRWAEEIGVLERGSTYQRIGLAFDEMGFGEQDERNETRILSPFGVPPILVGSRVGLESSTYSNYKQARQAFWEDTMVPENTLFEVDYQFHLNDGARFVAFDYAQVPAFQEVRQANQDRMLDGFKAGGVRRGEYRRAMGLPTLGPEDDDVFVLSNQQGTAAGILPAGAPADTTEQGGAQVDEDDRKVLHLPLKKKAHSQLNRKSGSLDS
jgi:HK97 family phage portal protein